MEGLIPYIYKAIKRSRRKHRYLKSLPDGTTQWYVKSSSFRVLRPPPIKLGSFGDQEHDVVHHRRHRSMEDLSGELSSPESMTRRSKLKDMKFGSSRFLACVGGA